MTRDPALPEAAREIAEKNLAQTRETYERSKGALEAAVDTLARSFDSLGQGSAALNRKIIEIAHRNVSSGFDLARSLAMARNLGEVVELRAIYCASSQLRPLVFAIWGAFAGCRGGAEKGYSGPLSAFWWQPLEAIRPSLHPSPLDAPTVGALAHLYRGEIYRSTIWRPRLDNTTNWAV